MRAGVIYALLAYFSWGLLPLYWKLFDSLPAGAILAHRILWSFLFVIGLLAVRRRLSEWKRMFSSKSVFGAAMLSAMFISINWLLFIGAVNSGHIVETSLGYYINPLMNIALGVVFLKERPKKVQWAAIGLATAGVLILTVSYGTFPWISIALAISFALYGFTKKKTSVDPLLGLCWETVVPLPIAMLYLGMTGGMGAPLEGGTSWLLVLSGVATAFPLLWFAQATKRLQLSTVGLFQYLAPTISLVIGVFLYHEPFTNVHMISFAMIWAALVIYTVSSLGFSFLKKREAPRGNYFAD